MMFVDLFSRRKGTLTVPFPIADLVLLLLALISNGTISSYSINHCLLLKIWLKQAVSRRIKSRSMYHFSKSSVLIAIWLNQTELVLAGRPVIVLSAPADAIRVDEFEVIIVNINIFIWNLLINSLILVVTIIVIKPKNPVTHHLDRFGYLIRLFLHMTP